MLRHIGKTTPLVIIFVSLCSGILLCLRDMPGFCFCFIFLILLCSVNRLIHVLLGMTIGIIAFFISPVWEQVPEGEHQLEGKVSNSGFYRGSYRAMLDDVKIDNKNIRGYVQLSVYNNVDDLLMERDILKGNVIITALRGFGNAGELDYKTYYLSNGITLTCHIKDLKDITVTRSLNSYSLKEKIITRLSSMSRPEAEVLKAILLGDSSGITYSIQDSFSSLGLTHLIAISGLNIGIVMLLGGGLIFTIIRLITVLSERCDAPLLSKIGGLFCVVIYTIFVGSSIPTLRSAIMAGCLISSFILARKPDLLESLSIAGIIILVLWPLSIYSVSFLLSFGAVLGIIGIYSKIDTKEQWVLFIIIPIVASAFTMPIVTYVFGFISLNGIIANIVFVPVFSIIIMPLALIGTMLLPFSETIAVYMFSISMDGISLIFKTSDLLGMLSPVPTPVIVWVYICYLGLIIAFFSRPSRLKIPILIGICLFIMLCPLMACYVRLSPSLMFDFISVGQGDSTLVTKQDHVILIDAGGSRDGFDTGRFIVGPHLLKRGITSIDILVITHSHPDHIGGVPFILERFNVGEVWTNVKYDNSPDFNDVLEIARKKSIPVKNVSIGDNTSLNSLTIEVLHPQQKIEKRSDRLDLNLHSVVLKIGDGHMKGLFMADADNFGELSMIHLERDISADVLKVSHHGSKYSCKNIFLDTVKPKIAVVSCKYDNWFNVPSQNALARLNKRGIAIYRTDINGEVIIFKKDKDLYVKVNQLHADN